MCLVINNGVTNKCKSSLICLMFVLGCVVIALLVVNVYFLIILGIESTSNAADESEKEDTRPVCTTRECVEVSADIIGKMDLSANPCEDMYQFSCGQHISEETTESKLRYLEMSLSRFKGDVSKSLASNDTSLYGRESSALAKMKMYHRLCTDEKSLRATFKSQILQLISDAGSWNLIDKDLTPFESSSWSLQQTLLMLHKMDVWPLFKVDVVKRWREVGSRTPENFIALKLGEPSSFEKAVDVEKKIEELALLTEKLGGDPEDAETVTEKIRQVLDFSEKLLEAQNGSFPRVDEFHPSQLISLKDLQSKLGSWLNLKEHLSGLFEGAVFADDTLLLVQALQYFIDVQSVLEKFEKEVHANYLMLWLLHSFQNILPTSWQNRKMMSRARRCTENTLNLFSFAAVASYVEQIFNHENKARVTLVAQDVKEQILATINGTTWLEEPLRKRLLEKAQGLKFSYGYPDWILDATSLDSYYANFEVIDGEILDATITARKELVKRIYKKDLPETFQPFTGVHLGLVMFSATNNTVIITVDQLQRPLFEPSFSKPFLYGGLGYILGHEGTHAFDGIVRNLDENGLPLIVWTPQSDEKFFERVECFIEQYSSQTLYGVHLHGIKSVLEDICDNSGVRLAYKAFKAHVISNDTILPGLKLTDEQLFFVGFSQTFCQRTSKESETTRLIYGHNAHSPSSYRVNLTLSNYPEFAKAFNCPLGSPMNPVQKCAVWE